jgi:hypothetical protein
MRHVAAGDDAGQIVAVAPHGAEQASGRFMRWGWPLSMAVRTRV